MSPSQMAQRLRRLSRRLPNAADAAMRDWARWSHGIALHYSSGRVRQAVFDTPFGDWRHPQGFILSRYRHGASTGLGHPYGHGPSGSLGPRGPIPYGDPARINVQKGDFFRSWRVVRSGNGWSLINDSDHARQLLEGTRLMIRRPYLDRIADAARARSAYFGAQALASAIR